MLERSTSEIDYVIDNIITHMNNEDYDKFITALNYFKLIDDKSGQHKIRVCMTTHLAYLSLLRVESFKLQYYYPSEIISWRQLINMIDNMIAGTGIPHNMNYSSCMLSYCQLLNIPITINSSDMYPIEYTVHRHRMYDKLSELLHSMSVADDDYVPTLYKLRYSTSIMELVKSDIEQLTDDNRQSLLTVALNVNHTYTIRLINSSDNHEVYNDTTTTLLLSMSWIPHIKNWILNQLRSDVNCEQGYTDPRLDSAWKCLTPQQIIEKEFNPEHLIKLGIEVPDIDIALADVAKTNILTVKRLLPYSNPSQHSIELVLQGVDNLVANCLEIAILLVIHKRELMNNYRNHPFVDHLISNSSTNWVKTH